MLTELLAQLGIICVKIISFLGYYGIFLLMTMESMVFPIPSELVMPFAGFLAAQGEMNFLLVVLFSSIGSIAGSLLSYYIGRFGGERMILNYGKYLLLDIEDLRWTEEWFKQRGEKTVLISRFIPVVRHLISIPAGMGKMDLKKFCLYTVIGATMWNTFLAYLGFWLGQRWELVKNYSEYVTVPVVVVLVIAGCYFVYKHWKRKRV